MKEHGFYAAGLKDVVLSDDIEICGAQSGARGGANDGSSVLGAQNSCGAQRFF